MGIYYGDNFEGVLLRCETRIIYEIKFDFINDKINEEIHKILEDVGREELSICVWTNCFSTFDNCEYMTWQQVTKEQLLSEMAKQTKNNESKTDHIP
jgi:hypothetical protein